MKYYVPDLISQLERATKSYEAASAAVEAFEAIIGDQPDVAGVSGNFVYVGNKLEKHHTIQLIASKFAEVAPDYGSGFTLEDRGEFTGFECTVFGYRVFCLAVKGSVEEALLLEKLNDEV